MNIDFHKPQRLEAASFSKTKSARVELVPFPVIFVTMDFILGIDGGTVAVSLIPPRARKY
jgi:hypothetical protein